MPVAEELITKAACPKCKQGLTYDEGKDAFLCHGCNLLYEVHEGIPNFIIEEAKELDKQ